MLPSFAKGDAVMKLNGPTTVRSPALTHADIRDGTVRFYREQITIVLVFLFFFLFT
jgi:hypothetical protein